MYPKVFYGALRVKCPAKDCYYKNNPYQVHKHALQCPFLEFYCGTCYGAYGAEILEHSL